MANIGLNLSTPNGWNRWLYAKSVVNTIQIPDASFPYLYTPSGGFWGQSIIDHCLIPWLNTIGAFEAFLLAGGATSSLLGSIVGLAVVSELFEISVHGQIFGIGRGADAPQMGFCIGNKFKEHVYTRMDVQNTGDGRTVTTNTSVELLQNYRYKRAYLDHGTIVRYTNSASVAGSTSIEHILTLDINKTIPPPSTLSLTGATITIANTYGSDITMNIISVKNNWDFVISAPPSGTTIELDNYYKISQTLCLEDPYLLSGFWVGTENTAVPSVPSSGKDLYITSHNSPYEEGKFLGTYIWKTDPTPEQISNGASSNVSSQPTTGYSMDDASGSTWAFIGFGNSPQYNIYPNDIRYRETKLDVPADDGSVVVNQERLKATNFDYVKLFDFEPDYLRVEIGTGGYTNRHNWYAPCLKGEYIKVKGTGKIHRILNHIEFNIIDVDYLDIKKTSKFNPGINQEYSIMNQSAWFINEHYDGRISTHNNTGVFKGGIISNTNDTKFVIQTLGDTFTATYKKNGLSFIDRYQKNVVLSSTMKQAFTKFEGWRLVAYNGKSYDIKSVDFSAASATIGTPYPITVTLKSKAISSDFAIGTSAYITFDKGYDVFGNFSRESGYSLVLDVQAAYSRSSGGPFPGFIVSDQLCLSGEFFTNPYKLDITSDDRIGFTAGYLFGLGANGSAQSNFNQLMFFTTPRSSRGISSIFHHLRKEDWIAYEDINGKMTVRRGSLNFTEMPMKSMIVIGQPEKRVSIGSSNPLVLDTNYDMLRRLGITFGSLSLVNNTGILFGIGSVSNVYGFYINGSGIVNLGFLTRSGTPPGSIPSSTYTGNGYDVSPIYVYNPDYYQDIKTDIVDIGVKTQDGPIYMTGGGASDVWAEYIKEKQTLSEIGFYDLVELTDGEKLFIYGNQVRGFRVGSNTGSITTTSPINNSSENGTKWSNQNAVMIVGTNDDSFLWGSPSVNRIDDSDNMNRYPLMILNSVDYLACIYNPMNQTLSLFCRCETKNGGQTKSYLGCFIKPIQGLLNLSQYCEPYPLLDTSPLPFKWSHPVLPNSFIMDQTESWTDNTNIINDGFSYISNGISTSTSVVATDIPEDNFIRVMGPISTNSQVQNPNEFGIISTHILPDGSYVVFYDSELGVKALFSPSGGYNWATTDIVFARAGRCGLLLGESLFYISSDGITIKHTSIIDYYNAMKIAGIGGLSAELDVQNTLDSEQVTLVGSGVIEPQRLSGYVNPEGITKIFYYNNRNLLVCMESNDYYSWTVANNF
jgi:hypothetical protein